jgi:hypothetical protein
MYLYALRCLTSCASKSLLFQISHFTPFTIEASMSYHNLKCILHPQIQILIPSYIKFTADKLLSLFNKSFLSNFILFFLRFIIYFKFLILFSLISIKSFESLLKYLLSKSKISLI